MWVPLLAILANHSTVIELVLTKESLGIVVTVNVDLSKGIVCGGFFYSLMDTGLQPGEEQLQPTSR